MKRNEKLNSLLERFTETSWLKPVDVIWNTVHAYHVLINTRDQDVLLDLGCGDGLLSSLIFGGRLPLDYDRFLNAAPHHQKIGKNQSGDIYSNPLQSTYLSKLPTRKINYGVELKNHHINVAESLGVYDKVLQGRFEDIPIDENMIDKVFSISAFYWGGDLDTQMKEVNRVLKDGGEFLVNLPSNFLFDMHLSKKMAEEPNTSDIMKKFYERMDGGRRALTTRYSRSKAEWREYFEKHNFKVIEIIPVVNEVMFTLQDISQRPFLPMFFKAADAESFKPFRSKAKEYLCKDVYPELIDELLQYESEDGVKHGYYLIRAVKTA